MDDLKNHFLERSVASLRILVDKFQTDDGKVPPDAFRTLHTIKGTAQTFGFAEAATLAHELEDLLAAAKTNNPNGKELLSEGISLLIGLLEQKDRVDPAEFSRKAAAAAPDGKKNGHTLLTRIPLDTINQLSETERNALFSLAETDIYSLTVSFDLASFTADFKTLREQLDDVAKVIATLPGASSGGQIGFRVYIAAIDHPALLGLSKTYSGTLEQQNIPLTASNLLFDALSEVAKHGEVLAGDLSKDVEIIVSVGQIETGNDSVKTIFDTLLHLVRNAIDHGISKTGNIRIGLTPAEGGIFLTFSDDGAGLDLIRLKAMAIERGLPVNDENLPDLIFLPGLSTAGSVSGISGRGVGLDAVKNLVEGAGGTIKVETTKGAGTRFELFLPDMQKREQE